MTRLERRFFFVHLQKTAGTTLTQRMRAHFGVDAVYPGESDLREDWVSALISTDFLLDRWRRRGDELRVVTGHFPLCTTVLLGGGFTTLTILRDPVERTLSWLRNRKRANRELRDLPLEEIYDDPVRFDGLVHNHMVKMFSLTVEEMTDGVMTRVDFDSSRLDRAKAQLATVDVVGLQDRFDDLCEQLVARFGWDLGEPRRDNQTEPAAAPADLVARIETDNADDIDLYKFGCELVDDRRDAHRSLRR